MLKAVALSALSIAKADRSNVFGASDIPFSTKRKYPNHWLVWFVSETVRSSGSLTVIVPEPEMLTAGSYNMAEVRAPLRSTTRFVNAVKPLSPDKSAVEAPKLPEANLIFKVSTFALSASGNAFIPAINFATLALFSSKALWTLRSNVVVPDVNVDKSARAYPSQ